MSKLAQMMIYDVFPIIVTLLFYEKFKFFYFLFKIILIFSNYFDVLILKINLKIITINFQT